MAAPTPVRTLLRHCPKFIISIPVRTTRRCLHTTPRRRDKKSSRHTHVGPLPQYYAPGQQNVLRRNDHAEEKFSAEESYPKYTEEELRFLRTKYTPEQMEAITAGEEAISAQDLHNQGVARTDYMKVDYLDDFSRIDPVLDQKRQPPESHIDPNLRFKTDEELDEDLTRWVDNLPEDTDPVEWTKFDENLRMTVGKEEAERQPIDYLAPELPKLTDPLVKRVTANASEEEYPNKAEYELLAKQTGLSIKYMRGLLVKSITEHRVVNQTRMGKIDSVYKMIIAGNGNGLIGIGEGKHAESNTAHTQALMKAIRNMQPIPRYEHRTIFGDVRGKVSGTIVELYNRPPGFGIRCQEKIWEVCRVAGITDLAARTFRSSNPMNTIKATVEALAKQRLPENVARGRGKKMVDVRKVYYAGNAA